MRPEDQLRATSIGVGHWTDPVARTGCTVVVLPEGTVASGEIRGGAPATREFGLLDPTASVQTIDAVVLSGGSAFGLAAADGVVAELETAGRGYPTSSGRVPIVVGMSLYDLGVGRADIRPGPLQGASAATAAISGEVQDLTGAVGAGTGATQGKWGGPQTMRDAGLGFHLIQNDDDVWVAALVAVNAFGFIGAAPSDSIGEPWDPSAGQNTTIGLILTNAVVDKLVCHRLAHAGHSGYAKATFPSHTAVDGDAVVAAATGSVPNHFHPMWLRAAAESAMTTAVLSVA